MSLDDKSIFDFEMPKADDSSAEFDFGNPQSDDFNNMDNEITVPTEPRRLMKCLCPKCAEQTEVDLALMPENGFVTTCSSCNKQIHIVRESCACRAKRKSYEINCADCGNPLDQRPHCPSCGKIFPDYFATFNPDDARRKSRKEFFRNKWTAVRDLNISFTPVFKGGSHEVAHGYSPTRAHTSTGTSKFLSRKFTLLVMLLVVTCVLVAAGTFAYNYYSSSQDYAENYFKALYGIKTAVDSNVKSCTSLKSEWESASASGRSFSPRFSTVDEAKSIKLRSEIDKYMQKMSKPPKRFAQANESLTKIYNVYLESDMLLQTKPRSLQELNSSVDSLSKKMVTTSQELKSNLSGALKQELENSRLKYRGMKDF